MTPEEKAAMDKAIAELKLLNDKITKAEHALGALFETIAHNEKQYGLEIMKQGEYYGHRFG